MKDLNDEQKAALIALLRECEKCLQVIAPIQLPTGDIMEYDWRRGVPRALPNDATASMAWNALEGEAREELLRRTELMESEYEELCTSVVRWKWEAENPIKAVKKGGLAKPSLVLRRFRVHLENNIAFLHGVLKDEEWSEPKKKAKEGKLSFPKNRDALEVLKEAKRRKTEGPKYAGKKNPDIIWSLITDGKPEYRYIIMEGRKDISKEKIEEYARRDDWGKERMRKDVEERVRLWSQYLSSFLRW